MMDEDMTTPGIIDAEPKQDDTTQGAGSATKSKKRSKKETEAILKRADERYREGMEEDEENRREALYDTKFCYKPGAQWDEDLTGVGGVRHGRLNLEINQLPQFVNQVVNDLRQNRAGIRLSPEGGPADEEEAKRRQGIIRGIEYDSRADAVYDEGGKDAAVGGRGYWRVVTDYVSPDSFEQKVVIKPIADFLSVLLDHNYQEPDGSDRQWAFVIETMTKAAFEGDYPNAEPLDWEADDYKIWFEGASKVIVCDYYERVAVQKTLVMLSDGMTFYTDAPPPMPWPPGVTEVNRREVDVWSVKW